MPLVRTVAEGEEYQPAAGERLLQLQNTGDVPLYLGIRNGEYLVAAVVAAETQALPGKPPKPTADTTYILTTEQYVRLQQQLALQTTYKNWIASGLLTIVEVASVSPSSSPPPGPEPEPDCAPEEEPGR